MLPHDLPDWHSVYWYFSAWQKDGTWKKLLTHLREELREELGRERTPSAGIIDSQSVKTTKKGVGVDGKKKRKRHIVTDTEGFLLEISVHQAGVNDKSGARLVLSKLKGQYPRLELLWGDKGYDSHPLEEWAEAELEAKLEIVKHPWDGQENNGLTLMKKQNR